MSNILWVSLGRGHYAVRDRRSRGCRCLMWKERLLRPSVFHSVLRVRHRPARGFLERQWSGQHCSKAPEIRRKIEDLENEIEDVKIAFEIKKLALDRMQLSTALKKNLEKINPKTNVLMDNMKHVLKLNKLIMKSQQESWDLEEKLLDVRKKRLQLKQASEGKLLEIQTEKNKQKDDLASMENSDKIKTIQQNLQMEIQITTVIQHVFQNLILGSKANWAEDSAFKETVLQLEKNLTMMLNFGLKLETGYLEKKWP
ncbi:hypothetical protein GH733_009771 [Mirounga leonina]|nr:hypothetical protein GH733_009771 [Mirounga leonina]